MITDAPIPGSFLRGSVTKEYVTISAPSTKVVMLVRDACAMMHWLYDVLPSLETQEFRWATDSRNDVQRRMSSYSDLWIRRRARA